MLCYQQKGALKMQSVRSTDNASIPRGLFGVTGGTIPQQSSSAVEEDEQGGAGREAVHALLVNTRGGSGTRPSPGQSQQPAFKILMLPMLQAKLCE